MKDNQHDEFCHCDECLGTFTTLDGVTYTVEQIRRMTMDEYAAARQELLSSIVHPSVDAEIAKLLGDD